MACRGGRGAGVLTALGAAVTAVTAGLQGGGGGDRGDCAHPGVVWDHEELEQAAADK